MPISQFNDDRQRTNHNKRNVQQPARSGSDAIIFARARPNYVQHVASLVAEMAAFHPLRTLEAHRSAGVRIPPSPRIATDQNIQLAFTLQM